MRIDWKSKERKGETFKKLAQHIIEKKHIYINANPLTNVLGLHATKGFYIKSRNWKLQISRVYATSAFCSMAEEGMANSAPAGGTGSSIARVEEGGAVEVAEAAEGEIIDTRAGANFFAFSKKAFNSERVRP
jgi:hypothetical protein